MSINTYLHRLRRWAKPAAKARPARPRLDLENLEDRLLLSTVDVSKGVLTYQADQGEKNQLEISLSGNTYTITETGGVAIDTDKGFVSSFTAEAGLVDSMQFNLEDKNDTVKVYSTDAQITINGGDDNDTVTVGDGRAGGRGLEDVTAAVVFHGGDQKPDGKDVLVLADRKAPLVKASVFGNPPTLTTLDYFVDGTAITRQRLNSIKQSLGSVRMNTTNVEELDVDASNQSDSIGVGATLADTRVVINAGDGNDEVSVGNPDLLASSVDVNGEDGIDTLTINDGLATSNRNFVINSNKVS
jgi:hypothetical protein